MALRSGYKGFKKLLGLKMIRPGTLAVDDTVMSETFFPRSEQAILGAGNFIPDTVYTLGMASTLGTVTLATNSEAVAYVAPIKRNTHYWISKSAGNRFRLALSNTPPANGSTATLIYTNDTALSYDFNSSTYDYVILLANIGEIDASTIKPLLALSKNTPYAPYTKTNEQLTDEVLSISSDGKGVDSTAALIEYINTLNFLNTYKIRLEGNVMNGITGNTYRGFGVVARANENVFDLFLSEASTADLFKVRGTISDDSISWSAKYKFTGTSVT